MALTLTEKLRASIGNKAFRCYEIVHDGTASAVFATSMDLEYIEGIIGHIPAMSMHGTISMVVDFLRVSIAADHKSVVWGSTDANYISTLTVFGW